MVDYGLPTPPDRHRWYLREHDLKYAKLQLQKKTLIFWREVTCELVNRTGEYQPFEVCMKEEANQIMRNLHLPKVKTGVVT